MAVAAAATSNGKHAVMRNTGLGPYASTRLPLKYALTTDPTDTLAQHRLCNDPAVLCGLPLDSSTTIESATTSAHAVDSDPAVSATSTTGAETTAGRDTVTQDAAPSAPHRIRYERRR